MNYQVNTENGKLDMVVSYSPDFECADIWPQDLEGMKARAKHYANGTKAERRLARDLSRAVLWIEREVYARQLKS